MVAFAQDYDDIPLHTDEDYAKTTPFGKLIAPGVMSFMSVWAKYLEVDFFGKELLAGKSKFQIALVFPQEKQTEFRAMALLRGLKIIKRY